MPKQRITKEIVVQAAFELAREGGLENVLVKKIAKKIGCSVQPIYCYCQNMDGLKQEVIAYTKLYLEKYITEHSNSKNLFESIGFAHCLFAKEEPYLYRLYFLRKRENLHSIEDIYQQETNPQIAASISKSLQIRLEDAKALHLHMMIYNIGISFILSTLGKETDIEKIKELSNQSYQAFSHLILKEKKEDF